MEGRRDGKFSKLENENGRKGGMNHIKDKKNKGSDKVVEDA